MKNRSAGSIDVGPLVGRWYLVVTIRAFRSLDRVDENIGCEETPGTDAIPGTGS